MSQAISPSTGQPSGLARVCRVWGIARSPLSLAAARAGVQRRPPGTPWSLCG